MSESLTFRQLLLPDERLNRALPNLKLIPQSSPQFLVLHLGDTAISLSEEDWLVVIELEHARHAKSAMIAVWSMTSSYSASSTGRARAKS